MHKELDEMKWNNCKKYCSIDYLTSQATATYVRERTSHKYTLKTEQHFRWSTFTITSSECTDDVEFPFNNLALLLVWIFTVAIHRVPTTTTHPQSVGDFLFSTLQCEYCSMAEWKAFASHNEYSIALIYEGRFWFTYTNISIFTIAFSALSLSLATHCLALRESPSHNDKIRLLSLIFQVKCEPEQRKIPNKQPPNHPVLHQISRNQCSLCGFKWQRSEWVMGAPTETPEREKKREEKKANNTF